MRISCATSICVLSSASPARGQLVVGRARLLDQRAFGLVERAGLRGQQRFLHERQHFGAVAAELVDDLRVPWSVSSVACSLRHSSLTSASRSLSRSIAALTRGRILTDDHVFGLLEHLALVRLDRADPAGRHEAVGEDGIQVAVAATWCRTGRRRRPRS